MVDPKTLIFSSKLPWTSERISSPYWTIWARTLKIFAIPDLERPIEAWLANVKRFSRKWLWSHRATIPTLAWRDWARPQNNSARVNMVKPRFKSSTSRINLCSLTATLNTVAKFWLTGILIPMGANIRKYEHKNKALIYNFPFYAQQFTFLKLRK